MPLVFHLQVPSTLFLKPLSRLGWLARVVQEPYLPPPESWDDSFLCGFWGLNLSFHTHEGSTLLTESSLQPPEHVHFFKIKELERWFRG